MYREQPIDYGALETSLRKSCQKMGLKDVDGQCPCVQSVFCVRILLLSICTLHISTDVCSSFPNIVSLLVSQLCPRKRKLAWPWRVTRHDSLSESSLRAPWRVDDVVVGRGNDGWTKSRSGHLCLCQTCPRWRPSDKTGRGSSIMSPDDPTGQGTEPKCLHLKVSRKASSYTTVKPYGLKR